MKKILLFVFVLLAAGQLMAQTAVSNAPKLAVKFAPFDKSPLDVVYYPANYPLLKIQDKATEPLVARLIYSRPQRDSRRVFGDLVPFNEVWRLGANEATELELYRDVKVQDKKLARGRYTIYAIPRQDSWTIIFNRETDTWGAFRYDASKDVLRVNIPVEKAETAIEAFSASFIRSASGADLVFAWDHVIATLPLSFK